MSSELPIVAIVGQPNVGKSTLINKISGQPLAVTSPVAGTTRDRQYIDTSWNGKAFTLADTAGLSIGAQSELEHSMGKQIEIALKEAEVVILVVDGRLNRLSVEQETLKKFRKNNKPLILCVNKLDSGKTADEKLIEFASLGIKNMFGVSSISGRGIGDMLDYVSTVLPKNKEKQEDEKPQTIAVSIVGKPNVGKSSIFNQILKQERVVVSPIPGTTRTAIDQDISIKGVNYTFIDTAGLKKKEHRQQQPDIYSGFQTFKSIRRSDVCFLVIDAVEEITKQDQRVAQEIFSQEKGIIILINKVDKFDGDEEKLHAYVSMHFPFLWMSPVFFVSGKTGSGLNDALNAIKPIYERRHKLIDNQVLAEFLNTLLQKNPPRLLRDQKKPKVFSLQQIGTNPPTFQLLVNHPAAISQQFRKFVENSIIKTLDFWGTPINLKLKGKDKT